MLPFLPVALAHCAPAVHPITLSAIVMQESGGNPLLIHDNRTGLTYRPSSPVEAATRASTLIKHGDSIDLGLGQINSKNLSRLGLDIHAVFDPCRNLAAVQTVLLDNWKRSGGALRQTLSLYNTGKPDSRAGASYAAHVYAKVNSPVPTIPAIAHTPTLTSVSLHVRFESNESPTISPLQPRTDTLITHW
jgi:type IV secretion system protein VirB1